MIETVLDLDQLAEHEERRQVGDPRRLLEVVGDDNDGVALLELEQGLLDLGGRDRIEGRGRLVEQQNVRLVGEGARDAQPLLLAAGKVEGGVVEPVPDLFPEVGLAERLFHQIIETTAAAHAAHPRAVVDILTDGHGEGVRFLEDHADSFPQQFEIHPGSIDVLALDQDLALDADALDHVVHAVETTQKGRFATARRSDEGGDLVLGNFEVDLFKGLDLTVVEVEVVRGEGEGVGLIHWNPYTVWPRYARRSRRRMTMAARFMSTTRSSRTRVVAKAMGLAASTFGDCMETS